MATRESESSVTETWEAPSDAGLKRAGHDVRAVGKDKTAIRETASWAEVICSRALRRDRRCGPRSRKRRGG
jgi:hypothetical protein